MRASSRRSIRRRAAADRGASFWRASTATPRVSSRFTKNSRKRGCPSWPRRRPRNGCATTITSFGRSCSKSAAIFRAGTTRSSPRSSAGDGAGIRASMCSRAISSPIPPAASIRSCCADSPTRIRRSRPSRSASSGRFPSCCGWRSSRTSAVSPCRRCARGRTETPRGRLPPSCCRFRRPSGGFASLPRKRRRRFSSRFFTTCATSRSPRPPRGDGCRRGWARAGSHRTKCCASSSSARPSINSRSPTSSARCACCRRSTGRRSSRRSAGSSESCGAIPPARMAIWIVRRAIGTGSRSSSCHGARARTSSRSPSGPSPLRSRRAVTGRTPIVRITSATT